MCVYVSLMSPLVSIKDSGCESWGHLYLPGFLSLSPSPLFLSFVFVLPVFPLLLAFPPLHPLFPSGLQSQWLCVLWDEIFICIGRPSPSPPLFALSRLASSPPTCPLLLWTTCKCVPSTILRLFLTSIKQTELISVLSETWMPYLIICS